MRSAFSRIACIASEVFAIAISLALHEDARVGLPSFSLTIRELAAVCAEIFDSSRAL